MKKGYTKPTIEEEIIEMEDIMSSSTVPTLNKNSVNADIGGVQEGY